MTSASLENKKRILTPELYKKNIAWFRGAIAYRLIKIMTPKPLSRRLPRSIRRPLLFPGISFPPGWQIGDLLPPGFILPEGEYFPPGWIPGDRLPDAVEIDTSIYFPVGWQPGDPLPESLILPEGVFLPEDWGPGDPLPEGALIDTAKLLPEDWQAGDPPPDGSIPDPIPALEDPDIGSPISPPYIAPAQTPGPTRVVTPPLPKAVWYKKFDNTHWTPWNANVWWVAARNRWEGVTSNFFLEVIGTWADGYRPTKIRVNHLGTDQTDHLLEDSDGDNIGQCVNCDSPTEYDLTFATSGSVDDIFWLSVMGDDPYITNIEFFVP